MIDVYKWHLPKVKINKVYKTNTEWDSKYLSINIVTINQPEYLKKCLATVYATTPIDFPASEINIWENGSSQPIQSVVNQAIIDAGIHPSFEVIFRPHHANIGFAAGHNEMVKVSRGKYLCMLNDDMEIFEQDWAIKMISRLSSKVLQVGAYNPSICNRLNNVGHGICLPPHLTEYCDGAFVVMNMEWARALGPWDTDVFKIAYCEDPDLSLRIRSLGYSINIVDINHIHHRAKTTSLIKNIDLEGFAVRNRARLLNRWDWYIKNRDFWVRIAIVREAAAGDALMATSLLSAVRELAPEAVIDVYTNFPFVFQNNPRLDGLFMMKDWPVNMAKYHCIIMLNNAYEKDTQELSYRAYYKVAGLNDEEIRWPELYFAPEELGAADKIINDHKSAHGNGPIAVFHTGKTNWQGRNLELHKFEIVARHLQSNGWSVIEIGGQETAKMDIQSTKLQGIKDLSARTTAAVISKASLFVGIDSYPWNVAQTCRIPSVVVFGCIDPKLRILDNRITVAVKSPSKACLGCHHEFRGPIHQSQCLRINTLNSYVAPCMEDIKPSQIIAAIETILKENTHMSETAKIREKVAEYITSDMEGIDIGCGPDKLYPTSVGFDKYKTNVVDYIGDARDLPWEDNKFDYVFSSHCLEDFFDKEGVLKEWCRVLKPGGKIALYLPHKDYYKGCNVDHYELFDSSYIKPILEGMGFTIDLDYLDIGDYNGVKDDRYSFLVVATKNG